MISKGLRADKTIVAYSELTAGMHSFEFAQSIETALSNAEVEASGLDDRITETEAIIKSLTQECDKTDYLLAASSGALCGLLDIFLVGKPGESPIGTITDDWFAERTKDFARIYCGWKDTKNDSLKSAIGCLENRFRIPYDQTGTGGAARSVFDLNPRNHHYKSLSHNPTLLGLFFSILDQFNNTSHFVSGGELISLQNADGKFELRGNNVPSKLFAAFVNWFGHLISDMSGSYSSKGRGTGIPSPIWCWANDIIVLKRTLGLSVTAFDSSLSELAIKIFESGYDARFQTVQAIPVFMNEMVVRLFYSVRRAVRYYSVTQRNACSFKEMWESCEPFSNSTVKRMLTVAHGTFCLIGLCGAAVGGIATGNGSFDVLPFWVRINIIGVGRFTISLYDEINSRIRRTRTEDDVYFYVREKLIIENYIEGLRCLSEMYDDKHLLTFIDDLRNSDVYRQAFEKSALLAEKRSVPEKEILRTKADIDHYFHGENENG